jgi:DNA/RNA endonuclease YhcR with UshA esterase domain
MAMPTEKLTITGVASRYRDGWQLMPRTANDIKLYTGEEVLDDINDPNAIPASGTGTEADPFNISAAIAKCQEVGETASTEKYYIKGIADADYTVDSYKNLTIDLVDKEGSESKFKVYRVKAADGKGLKEGYKISKGATIVVYGPVVNFKGNTPETSNGAYLVSVNGQAPELDGESGGGSGTTGGDVQTVTVAQFNAAAESTSVWYQLTGTIKNLKDGDKYGNFDLEDETGSVYVYGLLSEKGGEKQKFQELVAAKGIANGKKITIIGNRGSYNDKIEVMNAYFVSIE